MFAGVMNRHWAVVRHSSGLRAGLGVCWGDEWTLGRGRMGGRIAGRVGGMLVDGRELGGLVGWWMAE